MTTSYKSKEHYVVCVDNTDYPASLELHKIYRTVPDPDAEYDGDILVVDESGVYLVPVAERSFFRMKTRR